MAQLKISISFFRYYSSYVDYYLGIVGPLYQLKTVRFYKGPTKGRLWKKHVDSINPVSNG